MDFHSLTRRELQAFCKKNKIPANMTNAAMADALTALETVEGIEEFIQTSQSETAESCIETQEGLEVTSPYVPATGGRSTRRRNVVKEEVESVTVTRTRRTARKTASKASDESQADTVETPAVTAPTSRRKVQMSTACRKMDSELMECVEEEKKDVSMTPAASQGLTSRRKAPMPYSTRRSVRLAAKSVQMGSDVTSEGSELFKNEEVTKDSEEGQEVNQKEGLNNCTGVDEPIAIVEENSVSEVKSEDVDEPIAIVEENSASEVKSEDVDESIAIVEENGASEMKSEDVDESIAIVEENGASEVKSEDVEVQPHTTECLGGEDTVMPVYVSDEVQQSEVSGIAMSVEEDSKEKDVEIVAGDSTESKDNFAVDEVSEIEMLVEEDSKEKDIVEIMASDSTENKDNFAVNEASCEEIFCDEAEQELHDDMDATSAEDVLVKLTDLNLQQEDTQVVKIEGDGAEADSAEQIMKTEADEMETLQVEEIKQSADQEPSEAQPNIEEEAMNAVASVKNSPSKELSDVEDAPLNEAVKIMTDNKENSIMNEITDPAKDSGDNLEELSLRKLTKMLKELNLKNTKKSSKHNEATLPRTALQAVPENRLIDGNGQ